MEPSYAWTNVLLAVVPFGAYYCGIIIRKLAMPPQRRLSLRSQCLLGIPISLVVVSPFLPILSTTTENVPGYLLTLGLIMEHGMLVHETATKHLTDHLKGLNQQAVEVSQTAT